MVAARREAPLTALVEECAEFGALALAVPTDVADAAAVDELARRAVERFGGFDIWINNAGVYLAGQFADVPADDFRRVIDINLMGYVHGVRAALRQFQQQGRGVIINNCSIAGVVPMPYFSAYTTAKFGVLGLGLALRQELRGTGIELCTVLPSSVDTPIFQQAGNYFGRPLKAMTPSYRAEDAAKVIVELAEVPRRLVVVGGFGRMLSWLYPVMPSLIERVTATVLRRQHFRKTFAPATSGNLFETQDTWTGASGGWVEEVGLLTREHPDPAKAR